MMIGEQPGDREDLAGEPFVGPAGRLLDRALVDAGIDRDDVCVTNAVKHFKHVRGERGKQRIHRKPSRTEVVACRPWLVAELAAVRPRLAIVLGATAAQSLLGPSFKITENRGALLDAPAEFGGHPEHYWPPSIPRRSCAPRIVPPPTTGWSPTSRPRPRGLPRHSGLHVQNHLARVSIGRRLVRRGGVKTQRYDQRYD